MNKYSIISYLNKIILYYKEIKTIREIVDLIFRHI